MDSIYYGQTSKACNQEWIAVLPKRCAPSSTNSRTKRDKTDEESLDNYLKSSVHGKGVMNRIYSCPCLPANSEVLDNVRKAEWAMV